MNRLFEYVFRVKWLQCLRSFYNSESGGVRTHDQRIKSPLLYQAELPTLVKRVALRHSNPEYFSTLSCHAIGPCVNEIQPLTSCSRTCFIQLPIGAGVQSLITPQRFVSIAPKLGFVAICPINVLQSIDMGSSYYSCILSYKE